MLEEYGARATFFIVGEIAKKFPGIINEITRRGHEVSFHGWVHEPLWRSTPKQFREEVKAFKKICNDCIGFRAPSFSLNNKTRWALEILEEECFKYDSSVFPTWTPLYGVYRAPARPYHPSPANILEEGRCSIIEFPLTVYELFGLKIPIAGGFWLRFWGVELVKRGVRKINEQGFPAVIYVHNWELDHETPRIDTNILGRLQVYYNLYKAKRELASLLSEFNFTSFAAYIKEF
jgi:polysaccharide deacetylase family protein (PEP-CTERM system associated)